MAFTLLRLFSRRAPGRFSPSRAKPFYGWVLVGLAVLVYAGVDGCVYFALGVFLGPMADDMGWSRGSVSVAFSIFSICLGSSGPIMALLMDRFGLRRVMLAGEALIVVGLMLLSRVTHLWQLYMLYGVLLGFSRAGASYLALSTLLNNWFVRRRALVMGIAVAGSGLGVITLAPLTRYLIGVIGWRDAWLVLAGFALVLTFLPTLLLARDRPEEMGLRPDGDALGSPSRPRSGLKASASSAVVDWPARLAFRTWPLWIIAFAVFAKYFALQMLTTHQVVHLEDVGIAPVVAASALGLLTATSSIGMLTTGVLGQVVQLRYLTALGAALEALGIVVLIFARTLPLVYVAVFLVGPGYGMLAITFPSMVGAYYGRRSYALIFGVVLAIGYVVGGTSPIFAGYVFDATGSYLVPFAVGAALCGVAAIASLLAKAPTYRAS